jgi:hypothetical protein
MTAAFKISSSVFFQIPPEKAIVHQHGSGKPSLTVSTVVLQKCPSKEKRQSAAWLAEG